MDFIVTGTKYGFQKDRNVIVRTTGEKITAEEASLYIPVHTLRKSLLNGELVIDSSTPLVESTQETTEKAIIQTYYAATLGSTKISLLPYHKDKVVIETGKNGDAAYPELNFNLGGTESITFSASGDITATSFSGDGSNLTGISLGDGLQEVLENDNSTSMAIISTATEAISATGNVRAGSYYGDGSHLTGITGNVGTLAQVCSAGATTDQTVQLTKKRSLEAVDVYISGDLYVEGSEYITATETITGSQIIGGELHVDGDSYLGNQSSDTVQVSGKMGVGCAASSMTLKVSGDSLTTGSCSASAFYGNGAGLTGIDTSAKSLEDTMAVGNSTTISLHSTATTALSATGSIIVKDIDCEDILATGTLTASAFSGNGSLLTNLPVQPAESLQATMTVGNTTNTDIISTATNMLSGTGAIRTTGDVYAKDGTFTGTLGCSAVTGDGSGLTNLPVQPAESLQATMTVGASTNITLESVAVTAVNATGHIITTGDVRGNVGTFTNDVSGQAFFGSGANLTSLPVQPAHSLQDTLTVEASSNIGIVSTATDMLSGSGDVRAKDYYGNGSNLSGVLTSTPQLSAVLGAGNTTSTDILSTATDMLSGTGNVRALAFYGSGSNLTGVLTSTPALSAVLAVGAAAGSTGITSTATDMLSGTGNVKGLGATFTGSVSASAFFGSGAGLTGITATTPPLSAVMAAGATTPTQLTSTATTMLSGVGNIYVGAGVYDRGSVWTARTAAEANAWEGICYGNGLFVATSVTGTNRVMTSPDGITWTARAAAEANQWYSVCYGNGLFVAVSEDGTNKVMTSPDGITWTARTEAEEVSYSSVCYGNGLFVAVSQNGNVMTSPDGITWTARTAAEANAWYNVCYGGGLFVAVSLNGTNRVMTSPDGITWTARAAAEANEWTEVCYGNGLFVAVGQTGTYRVMTSPNGITWTGRGAGTYGLFGVAYGNGLFVAVSRSGTNRILTSPDGIAWTLRTSNTSSHVGVCYGNGVFVVIVEEGSNRAFTSGWPKEIQNPTKNQFNGPHTFTGPVSATSTANVTGAVVLGSTLSVAGSASITGALACASTLTVTGSANYSSTINASGDISTTGKVKGANVETGLAGALLIGPSDTDGSWKIVISGADLVIQKYVTDTWVTKSTISG